MYRIRRSRILDLRLFLDFSFPHSRNSPKIMLRQRRSELLKRLTCLKRTATMRVWWMCNMKTIFLLILLQTGGSRRCGIRESGCQAPVPAVRQIELCLIGQGQRHSPCNPVSHKHLPVQHMQRHSPGLEQQLYRRTRQPASNLVESNLTV